MLLSLSLSLSLLSSGVQGASKLSSDDKISDDVIESAKVSAQAAVAFLSGVKSNSLAPIPAEARPEKVNQLNQAVQAKLGGVVKSMEGLLVKEVSETDAGADIGDAVERQMLEAARAIEAATARLMELMNAPKAPEVSAAELNVNQALLTSAMAITSAIAQLMRAATLSQQEIVAKGRGSANASEFYKKNNRWTDGLISAARSVAIATTHLVETADGIMNGTHTIEQMVVAAQEVAASTAQLVAASRVKADKGSKTQENLERASKAVTEATKVWNRCALALSQDNIHIFFVCLAPGEGGQGKRAEEVAGREPVRLFACVDWSAQASRDGAAGQDFDLGAESHHGSLYSVRNEKAELPQR